jgi:beta-galactosidase
MIHKITTSFLLSFIISLTTYAASLPVTEQQAPEVSVAGFYPIADQGRQVWNFNTGWRFHLGDIPNASNTDFDDSNWDLVTTPHTVQLEPSDASGNRNYQGIAWYRKHFVVPASRAEVYFEAVMGKQKIYVNGQLALEHVGGYLPFTVDLSKHGLKKGDRCVIAVMADNSDDKSYPPGKPQYTLDFAYHGGIYRDVWLIGKNDISITDAIEANHVAGGGVFVHFDNISSRSADVLVNTEVDNRSGRSASLTVEQQLVDAQGRIVGTTRGRLRVQSHGTATMKQQIRVTKPHLWSPESPYLYHLVTRIKHRGNVVDGGKTRIGIRSFEFRGKEGFYLNGKRYRQFVGANRHQDFAYVGNALPNSQQWRDAKRLKNAGFNLIRTAHYPQDPAFMDACDELGLFVIVATPGWQYWNKNPEFGELVHRNTREIIRRDRNHPSVLMWEPILNETRFPLDFSKKALQITKEEYPYPYRPVAAADMHSAGVSESYDVVYGWPGDDEKPDVPRQNILTREFGEYVDDWYAHNNLNRASRSWGEKPQLTQALSLSKTTNEMYQTTGQFLGGCQWHPFDHQRGYHPDTYFGGIYDVFRQPKYAYYMFASQRDARKDEPIVFIAHEMSQFSDADVTIFTNCDSVRLTAYDGAKSWTLATRHPLSNDYNAPLVFKNVWDFWEARNYSYTQKSWQKVKFVAEGYVDGKVVCTTEKMPSRRSTKLRLYVDDMGKPLVADGSDFVVVVAEVTDDNGNVRRLAKEYVRFTVIGEGEIIDNGEINANPRLVEWGSAPILVRSTTKAGTIKIHAEVQFPGTHAPTPADLEITSIPSNMPFCMIDQKDVNRTSDSSSASKSKHQATQLTQEEKEQMLKAVEQQQSEFGIGK